MWKKILPMALVLVVVFSFAACVEEPSAQEIVDGVIESFDNIRTYQFDMDMTMDMTGEAEGETLEMTVTMDNSGTLDLENVQMRADLTMNMNMVAPEEDEMEEGVEMYIIDGMMYAMPEAPGEEPMWMKEEVPAEAWETLKGISGLETYKELLETAQVKVIGSEKVKGVDCYVLQLTPDMAQLWQIVGPGGVGGVGILPAVPEEFLQEIFRSFSVKQWIAKDTYFLMKVEIDMIVESTPEFMDYLGEEGEMIMDITMTLLAYDYNKPVNVELPTEAEEAISLESAGYSEAAETEFATIQTATHALMVDNEIATLPNPVIVATNDMSAFPDTSVCGVDKINDTNGNAYQAGDKDGYILYQHDLTGDGAQIGLVNYIVSQYTTGTYTVDANGTVTQVTTGWE